MIGCPGPGTKRLVGLHRVRPSLAAVCIHFQPGRSGSPEAWYTLARTCRAVQRARPHGDGAVHYRQDRDADRDWTNRHDARAADRRADGEGLGAGALWRVAFPVGQKCIELIFSRGEKLPLHGVQGVECSNHSVPTKKLQRIQSLNGDWIFLWLWFFAVNSFLPHFLPHREIS